MEGVGKNNMFRINCSHSPTSPHKLVKSHNPMRLGVLYFGFLALHKGFAGDVLNLGHAKCEVARTPVINVRLIMIERMCKRAERS